MSDGTQGNVVPVSLAFPADDPGFRVVEARGSFAMSETYELELLVHQRGEPLAPRPLLGRACVVSLFEAGAMVPIPCVVKRVRQVAFRPDGVSEYILVLVPPLWLLSRRRNHKIWRDLRVDGLTAEMLSRHPGLPPVAAELVEDRPARPYRVQYGDTDLGFLLRTLAEEGIASYFDFGAAGALTLTDDTVRHRPHQTRALPFAAPSELAQETPIVYDVAGDGVRAFQSSRVRDYWFEQPLFDPVATAAALPSPAAATDLEDYEYLPGAGSTEGELRLRARDLYEADSIEESTIVVRTNSFVWPGQRLTVEGAPGAEPVRELLVLRTSSVLTTQAGAPGRPEGRRIEHRLLCVPASVPFKPERLPKPRVGGVQVAHVVGEGEIDVDEHGRVLLRFPWDSAAVSIRVRVSQGWAGPGLGLVTIPRVGDEVLVAYLDGDAAQPMVVGRVHNGLNRAPLDLPKEKTVSVWRSRSSPGGEGYNEIRMDDLAGAERLDIHAQRDMSTRVERHADVSIGQDAKLEVGGNQKTWVAGSGNVGFKKDVDITAERVTITGRTELELNGAHMVLSAGRREDMVEGDFYVAAGSEQHSAGSLFKVKAPKVLVQAADQIELVCGGSKIVLTPGKITIEGAVVDVKGHPIKLNC